VGEPTNPGTDTDVQTATPEPTSEVGSEGGSEGDVDVSVDSSVGTGSEAGETWRPADTRTLEIVRDEAGQGRRSP
jgi:hypothetical protein